MTLTKTKPRRPTVEHRKRTGQHHHHGHHYIKTYWPYLPMVAILSLGILVNSLLGQAHRSVLGYATDMSIDSLLSGTNAQRADNGLGTLALNTKLDQAAQAKANDMAARDYWSHDTPDGKTPWTFITAAGYSYQTAGENLAYGFDTSSDTIAGWMNSPGHRANILNTSYREVGFGITNIPNYQSSGPETLVVAMYASPASQAAAATQPVASTPKPVTQVQPSPAPTTQPTAQPASPADTQPASEQPTKDTPAPALATTKGAEDKPAVVTPEPNAQAISRIQLVASNAPLNIAVVSVLGLAGFAFLLFRHSLAWHKRLIRGERFILHHPAFDLTAVSVVSISIVLCQTTGLIR